MKGKVTIFNATKGVGFIGEQFFHWSHIQMEGFKAVLPGWEVEYDVAADDAGRPQAVRVRPLELTGLTVRTGDVAVQVDTQGELVDLSIDALGRIYALNKRPVSAHVEAEGRFRAYYVGSLHLHQFGLYLPASTAERAFVLLDQQKSPRKVRHDGQYKHVGPGTYFTMVEKSGRVVVANIGRRFQPTSSAQKRGDTWLVVERRFVHQYDLSVLTAEALLAQTPTSGKTRDNDGFIPGILRGCAWMSQAATAA